MEWGGMVRASFKLTMQAGLFSASHKHSPPLPTAPERRGRSPASAGGLGAGAEPSAALRGFRAGAPAQKGHHSSKSNFQFTDTEHRRALVIR